MSLKNKTILLTGASKGIALALVLLLATQYTNIRFVASEQNEPKEFKKDLEKLSSECSFFEVSVFDESVAATATKEIWSSFGVIDFMKNNAGYCVSGSAESISAEGSTDRYFLDHPKQVVVKELIIHSLSQEY